jgi:glyoxylase-like metal-dependent hydrolase (beta-lactamase superfamily II)
MSKYVIHPLVVGINETDQGIMTYQKGYGKRIYLPIYVFYLEGSDQDVDIVIQTHLHNDHCENTYKCTNARVYVQREELDFFKEPHPLDHRYYSDLLDESEVVPVEGDTEIVPGVRVVLTPGHTPGGQSVVVETDRGTAVITGFCCNADNFPSVGPAVTPGVHLDAIKAYESAQHVRELGDILIPIHDIEIGRSGKIPA